MSFVPKFPVKVNAEDKHQQSRRLENMNKLGLSYMPHIPFGLENEKLNGKT